MKRLRLGRGVTLVLGLGLATLLLPACFSDPGIQPGTDSGTGDGDGDGDDLRASVV